MRVAEKNAGRGREIEPRLGRVARENGRTH
jgi:hypothetical protein